MATAPCLWPQHNNIASLRPSANKYYFTQILLNSFAFLYSTPLNGHFLHVNVLSTGKKLTRQVQLSWLGKETQEASKHLARLLQVMINVIKTK